VPKQILIADTQETVCWAVSQAIRESDLGVREITALTPEKTLDALREYPNIRLAVVDCRMMRTGSEEGFIRMVREAAPGVPLIVTATLFLDDLEERLDRLGCRVRLQKPFSPRYAARAYKDRVGNGSGSSRPPGSTGDLAPNSSVAGGEGAPAFPRL